MLQLTYAGLTDRGQVRPGNEDAWGADPALGLFVVSDGMGGRAAGGRAARIVVETLPVLLRRQMRKVVEVTHPEATRRLLAAIAALSAQIRSGSKGHPGLDGMGATVVLALIRGAHALIAHLGDSRAYLVRQEHLEQLTTDHSLVQLLLACGELTPNEMAWHPARGQVTRYVGMEGDALPEAHVLSLCPGDSLLLCSDGLTDMVSAAELLAILGERCSPKVTCSRLIAAAKAAGGADNVTVLIVSVLGGSTSSGG
jgi:protein phosphatase